MKSRSLKIILFSLAMVSAMGVMAGVRDVAKGAASKHRNLFMFKTKRDLVGGQIEVFNSNGELVTTQTLQKKKLVIDFADARLDTYTIRVTKGNSAAEYHFVKQ